ncbi:Zinc finger, GRF-type [Sesbania bispinosa]|nr:Zinc finger, GRF-type [Sesbania bispinosa]
MKGKGNDSVRDKHNSSCKSSSSSSFARRVLCDCGEEVALLQSKSTKNTGRMFWRCPNWNRQMTCNFFKWADGVVCDMQHPRFEDSHFYEDEIEGLKRKVTKL